MTWAYFTQNMGEVQARHLLPRYAERALARKLETFPVVVVTLDDVLLRDEARRDPELFLDRGGR